MTRPPKKREPHRHTVLRYLSLAIGEAQIGRAPVVIQRAIKHAIQLLFDSKWQGRKR